MRSGVKQSNECGAKLRGTKGCRIEMNPSRCELISLSKNRADFAAACMLREQKAWGSQIEMTLWPWAYRAFSTVHCGWLATGEKSEVNSGL